MTPPSTRPMREDSLVIFGILEDQAAVDLMAKVFDRSGDELAVATDLAEGLARCASEVPDLVFLDVSMGRSAGLALVHHLKAVCPNSSIQAVTRPDTPEAGTQAVALGAEGLLMLPLSGDELLTAASAVRSRRAQAAERRQLEDEAATSRRGISLVTRVAGVANTNDRAVAARQLAEIFADATGANPVIIYLPAGERSKQLMIAHSEGDVRDAPSFCEEMDLLVYARNQDWRVVPLAAGAEKSGLTVLGGVSRDDSHDRIIDLIAAQAATTFALIGEREHSHRGAMKDPTSSAYTFAYFVDVAGREIDKARRHDRRFALATLSVETPSGHMAIAGSHPETPVAMVERILTAVRDTDILARVDDYEFYLLLPETGGIGAHSCRRRVMWQADGDDRRTPHGPELTMGVATYPHDGVDLSRLLRSAKHRAEACSRSVVRTQELKLMPLGEILDTVLWSIDENAETPETPRAIELPTVDVMGLAVAALAEALRGGETRVMATTQSGMSLGVAIKAYLGPGREDVLFTELDISDVPGCRDIDAVALVAEHGSYCLVGRREQGMIRALHSSDPLLVDLIMVRLGEAAGVRLPD